MTIFPLRGAWRRMMLAAACLALLAACATTSLTSTWRDPGFAGGNLSKLLVVGITRDATIRRTFEDIFSAQLKSRGVQAIPSYTLIPQDGQVDEATLKAAVKKSGADAVITTRVVGIDQRTATSPGYAYYGAPVYPYPYAVGVPPPGMAFYGYYANTWSYYQPPTTYSYEEATLETSLFDATSGKLVWVATTRTFETQAAAKASSELAKIIIDELTKEKLI